MTKVKFAVGFAVGRDLRQEAEVNVVALPVLEREFELVVSLCDEVVVFCDRVVVFCVDVVCFVEEEVVFFCSNAKAHNTAVLARKRNRRNRIVEALARGLCHIEGVTVFYLSHA